MKSDAIFSECRAYRYSLIRRWADGPIQTWIMLNPSTADEVVNDPTVERCQRRATSHGFGALEVVNIFALRSTDPKVLYGHDDPVGPLNDNYILDAAKRSNQIVCGWGAHGALHNRGFEVAKILKEFDINALATTKGGQPRHPLYISYDITPKAWINDNLFL
jgi:hypothetical protein